MFGLKIVKKQDYLNLEREVTDAQALLAEKYGIIRNLENEVKRLNDKIASLENELNAPKKTTNRTKKVELLVDVAEAPLVVEKKKTSKPRKKKVE